MPVEVAMRTRVTLERNTLKFAAAHMATFRGQVEPLHGHNYAVIVECQGPLTDDAWVIDFGYVKQTMRRLCDGLDHKFLLQQPSQLLAATESDDAWELLAEGRRRYLLPKSDVLLLPIRNSTAEQIAGWLHGRLCAQLRLLDVTTLETVTVGVEEAPGQTGWYTSAFPGAG
jgi:6-pyruvoyl-tetrahydropterin synthase